MYVQRNKEGRSCNYCCCGKAVIIAYYECVFVSLVIQHAMCMRHIAICGLSGSTVSFHIISKTARFSKKLLNIKCVFWFSLQLLSETCHYKDWARYDQKCILVFTYSTSFTCQILMKLWFSRQIFEKYTNIKFHENPSSGSRVPSGRTDGQTNMTKLIVAFRNLANAPKTAYNKNPQRNSVKGRRT